MWLGSVSIFLLQSMSNGPNLPDLSTLSGCRQQKALEGTAKECQMTGAKSGPVPAVPSFWGDLPRMILSYPIALYKLLARTNRELSVFHTVPCRSSLIMSSNIIKMSATWQVKTCSPKLSSWSFIGVAAECMAWFSAAQVIGLRIELRTRQRRSIAPSPLSAGGHQFPTPISDLSDLSFDAIVATKILFSIHTLPQLPHSCHTVQSAGDPKCSWVALPWFNSTRNGCFTQ